MVNVFSLLDCMLNADQMFKVMQTLIPMMVDMLYWLHTLVKVFTRVEYKCEWRESKQPYVQACYVRQGLRPGRDANQADG